MRLIIEFLKRLTPSGIGWGPGLVLYALLASAAFLLVALDWAAKNFVEQGPLYAKLVGANCLAFIAWSAWLSVSKRGTMSVGRRLLVWAESVPLAVALIVSLAYAAIAGSVYSAVEPAYGKAHIFHSWWYLGLLAALATNLVLCSWESSWRVFQLPGRFDPRPNPGFYKNARNSEKISFRGSREQAEKAFRATHRRARLNGEGAAYVQKGVFARFGPTVVHIGLLFAMAAGGYRILSERVGLRFINDVPDGQAIPSERIRWMGLFDSQIQIMEGETKSVIMVKKDRWSPFSGANSRDVELDFEVKCHNFEAEMYPGTQTPRYFGSLLELTDRRTGEKKLATIDMNTAASFNGYKFSQNSYSAQSQSEAPRAEIEIVETATGKRHRIDVGPGARNKLAPKGELSRYQVEVEELVPGAPWMLYDASLPGADGLGKPLAQGNLLGAPGGAEVEAVAFYRHFQIGEAGPVDVSEEMKNPALLMRYSDGDTLAFPYVFPQTGFAFDAPEGLEFRVVDMREAIPDDSIHGAARAERFEKTGDADPLPRPDLAPADANDLPGVWPGEETDPQLRRRALQREAQRHVTEALEFKLAVVDAENGKVLAEGWTGLGKPLEVPSASLGRGASEGDLDAAVEAARQTGERFVARLVGPAQGYMTVLGVIRDPSLPYLYAGCIIVIFGVLQCFCATYRESWMLYSPPKEPGAPATVRLAVKKIGSGDKPFEEMAAIKARLEAIDAEFGPRAPEPKKKRPAKAKAKAEAESKSESKPEPASESLAKPAPKPETPPAAKNAPADEAPSASKANGSSNGKKASAAPAAAIAAERPGKSNKKKSAKSARGKKKGRGAK